MISIITPVYNSVRQIKPYLQSIFDQKYRKIEVLLIDDHSTDGSIDEAKRIIESYGETSISFRFFSTPYNSGPGVARNIGIDNALGEYIAFVDSDDTIHSDFCRLLNEKSIESNCELCCCNIQFLDEKGKILGYGKNPRISSGVFEGKNKRAFLTSYVSYFTTFLYKKTLLDENHLRFTSGKSSEDSMLLACALICCNRIAQVHLPLYHYWKWTPSLTMKKDEKRYIQKMDSMDNLLEVCRKNRWYDDYNDEIDYIYFKKGYMVSIFNYITNTKKPSNNTLSLIQDHMRQMIPDYKKCPYIKNNIKFFMLDKLISLSPIISILIIKLYLFFQKTML